MNKPYDLEERLIDFAVDVINVVEVLPNSKASNHIANQQASSWRSHASNRIANGTPSGTSHFKNQKSTNDCQCSRIDVEPRILS